VTDAFSLMDTPSAEMERQVETQALGCASGQDLQAIVDQAFDTGQPPVAGISSSVYKPGCATFAYARGQRDVAAGKAMTTATKIPFGSLTKSFTGALILRILEQLNQFGSPEAILNSPVSQYFSQDELRKLSSNCGNSFMIRAVDRATGATAPTVGRCPDWSKVKIRDLIHANSGNISLEEQDINQPPNDVLDYDDYVLRSIVVDLGIPTFSPITEPTNAFGVLDRYNIYRHPTAMIGGNSPTDFPGSFANTDYALLGMLLERATAGRVRTGTRS
jgi:CubicO group peptidase (beta-lactamase class C family)